MKKQLINIAICGAIMLSAVTSYAATNAGACMRKLPETILFTHIKDPMQKLSADFRDYESEPNGKGLGYSQAYGNNICFVTAFLYDLKLKKITAADIQNEQRISEQQMLKSVDPTDNTVNQVFVTFVDDYFLKLRTTCTKIYSGEEAKYNDMTARVVSATVEEQVSESLKKCLK